MPRIDSLKPGTKVTLDLGEPKPEAATFIRMDGEGESRRAVFETPAVDGLEWSFPAYTWDAYRFQGRWAFGSSADRLRLVSVD